MLRPHILILAISTLLFGILFVLGLIALWHRPDEGKLLISWLVVPILGIFAVSVAVPSFAYNVRYVAMAFPAYVFILAEGIASLKRPIICSAVLTAVLLINGVSLVNYYYEPRYSREDARAAARFLEQATAAGDAIIVVGAVKPLEYYYKGHIPFLRWSKAVIGDQSALADHLQAVSEAHDRIWLVAIRYWQMDPRQAVKAALDDRYPLVQHQQFAGVDIYAYDPS